MKSEEKIKEMLEGDTSFDDLYVFLIGEEIGDWDRVNSKDTIEQYLTEMIEKGIHVSHILKAIEENPSKHELYGIWLGNSMQTPTPINSKKDLITELEIKVK